MDISGANKAQATYQDSRNRRIAKILPIQSRKKERDLSNKMMAALSDADALAIIASSNYIEKLPKKDRDLYYAYLYCVMGYDW